MSVWKFLHAADLHLDSPLRGLEAGEAPAEEIRGASRRALGRLVDLALAEPVALVLIAGDIFDGDWPDLGTGLFFRAQMRRLADAGIAVVAVRGNHDAQNRISRAVELPITLLRASHAQSRAFPELGAVVHGQSYAERDGAGIDPGAWPAAVPGMLNIGLLHTCLEQSGGVHARYVPCTRATLEGRGYDYWALGHIHARQVVAERPWIVFPGNLQGRDVNETGPKGATLVTVADGRIAAVEARVLDLFRWARPEVDLSGATGEATALARVQQALAAAWEAAERRPMGARLRLAGRTAVHGAHTAAGWREAAAGEAAQISPLIWVEGVEPATAPLTPPLEGRADALGALARRIAALAETGAVPELEPWLGQMREGLPELPPDHPLHDPGRLLAQARDLLLARLAGEG